MKLFPSWKNSFTGHFRRALPGMGGSRQGTGVLRQEMRRYLSKHPLVRSQRPADPQHGGAGATQVDSAINLMKN